MDNLFTLHGAQNKISGDSLVIDEKLFEERPDDSNSIKELKKLLLKVAQLVNEDLSKIDSDEERGAKIEELKQLNLETALIRYESVDRSFKEGHISGEQHEKLTKEIKRDIDIVTGKIKLTPKEVSERHQSRMNELNRQMNDLWNSQSKSRGYHN